MAHVTLVEIECEGNLKIWCDGPCWIVECFAIIMWQLSDLEN